MQSDLWVAEFSASQGCFHVDTLDHTLLRNVDAVRRRATNDYQIFGIFETAEQANAACDIMEKKQTEAQQSAKRRIME